MIVVIIIINGINIIIYKYIILQNSNITSFIIYWYSYNNLGQGYNIQ